MKEPEQLKSILGWENVDCSTKHFICMCKVGETQPFALSGHHRLTYALRANGNQARHWKAQVEYAKETGVNSHNRGIWMLTVESIPVKLYVKYIDKEEPAPVPINYMKIQHEQGMTRRSDELIAMVRQKL